MISFIGFAAILTTRVKWITDDETESDQKQTFSG